MNGMINAIKWIIRLIRRVTFTPLLNKRLWKQGIFFPFALNFYKQEVFRMFRGIVKLPSYIRIEVDEYELEQFVAHRYEGRFGESPQKLKPPGTQA